MSRTQETDNADLYVDVYVSGVSYAWESLNIEDYAFGEPIGMEEVDRKEEEKTS